MQIIKSLELDRIIKNAVLNRNIPILGICLGMQLLGKSSTEDGFTEGLNIFDGIVEKFTFQNNEFKVPHVGFNNVSYPENSILYSNLNNNSDFYFVHSYRMTTNRTKGVAYCNYGESFVASYEENNVFGTQFHPEKSQTNGLVLLENFIKH